MSSRGAEGAVLHATYAHAQRVQIRSEEWIYQHKYKKEKKKKKKEGVRASFAGSWIVRGTKGVGTWELGRESISREHFLPLPFFSRIAASESREARDSPSDGLLVDTRALLSQ